MRRLLGPVDLLVGLTLVLIGILHLLGRLKGLDRWVPLTSDVATYVAIALAQADPSAFAADDLLGHPATLTAGRGAYLAMVAGALDRGFDPGMAITLLAVPVIVAQGLGFYLLGRVMFADRLWAASLAAATLWATDMGSEYWGIWLDVEPISLARIAMPYLVAAALAWYRSAAAPAAVMGLAVAVTALHLPSGLVIGSGLWTGLAASRPAERPWRRHLAAMGVAGLVFMLGLAIIGGDAVKVDPGAYDYDAAFAAAASRMPRYFPIHPWLEKLASQPLMIAVYLCFPVGWLAWRRYPGLRPQILFWGGFAAATILLSLVVPALEHAYFQSIRRLPPEVSLPRGIAFLVPALVAFAMALLRQIRQREIRRRRAPLVDAVMLAAVGAWIHLVTDFTTLPLPAELRCLAAGRVLCPPTASERALPDLMDAVARIVPPATRVLPESHGLAIAVRSLAHRPVAYSQKDGGLIYANGDVLRLIAWAANHKLWLEANAARRDSAAWLSGFLTLARAVGVRYLVLAQDARRYQAFPDDAVLFVNEAGSIVKLPNPQPR